MCKEGQVGKVRILNKDLKSFRTISVDKCLVPLIRELNKHGLRTQSSCCGHGFKPDFFIALDLRCISHGVKDNKHKHSAIRTIHLNPEIKSVNLRKHTTDKDWKDCEKYGFKIIKLNKVM